MDNYVFMGLGYLIWCCFAFIAARYFKIENAQHKPLSLLYIIISAPLVLIDYLFGKGFFH